MKLVDVSTRRPVSVFIFTVAAVVFGVVAYSQLATDLLPDITYPSLTVQTDYEGAAPLEVESLVTRPVENAVGVVNGVQRVSSSSRADISEVTLEFAWGTDMDLASLDVRERLDVLRLPLDAERSVLLRYDPSLDPILRLGLTGGSDLLQLRVLAEEEVQRRLERIEGIAAAVVSGGLEEEIQVEVDESRLSALGLTVDQVASRLAQENVNLTGGRLEDGRTEYLVRTVGELLRPEDLREVIVGSRGATVRLEDIATVRRGFKEREIITRIDGRESVEVAIYKEGGTNTVAVSEAVREALTPIEERLLQIAPDSAMTVVTDQARYIRQSVREVRDTAIYGGLLAILVLFLFLRSWKPTLIIGAAIPVSVVASFFLMYLSDVSLNIISLGGLTLGIGLLVDNAIVVLEAIQRRRDAGLADDEAARVGAAEVAPAVVASTLTTLCVFVPVVFVEGIAGQLFGDQALTVTFSLTISLVVALTLIPMLAALGANKGDEEPQDSKDGSASTRSEHSEHSERSDGATDGDQALHRRARRAAGRGAFAGSVWFVRGIKIPVVLFGRLINAITSLPAALFGRLLGPLASAYDRALRGVLAAPLLTVLAALVLLGGSLFLASHLGQELVPEMVQGELFVDLQLPPGSRLEVTDRRLRQIEAEAAQISGVATVYALVGSSAEQGGVAGERREHIGQITLTVEPPVDRAKEEAIITDLRQRLEASADLEHRFGRPSYFSFRTPVEVEIRGFNLELLERLADRLLERLETIDGLADLRSSTEGGNPELQITFDRRRLSTYDLTVEQVASTVRNKIQGLVATDIQRLDRTVDIRVRVLEAERDSVEALANLTIHDTGTASIPLSAVATITVIEGPAEIRRADGDRTAVITASLDGRDLASVSDEIRQALDELSLPAGFDTRVGGQRAEMATSFDSLQLALFLAVFMVYLVMASQFESLIHPFVILFSVPFSLIGVLVTLWIFQVAVSVVVLMGAVLLAGIVVNNAILLVDTTNRLRREEGLAKLDALRAAGHRRLRPILMTTATTVLGLLPMALGLGEGSELRSPMALTVIGGLLTSTFLTLLVIPAVYSLVDRGR